MFKMLTNQDPSKCSCGNIYFLMPTFISKFDRFMPIDVPCMELGNVSNAIDETNISSGPI